MHNCSIGTTGAWNLGTCRSLPTDDPYGFSLAWIRAGARCETRCSPVARHLPGRSDLLCAWLEENHFLGRFPGGLDCSLDAYIVLPLIRKDTRNEPRWVINPGAGRPVSIHGTGCEHR